jgi:hypothetical protein
MAGFSTCYGKIKFLVGIQAIKLPSGLTKQNWPLSNNDKGTILILKLGTDI